MINASLRFIWWRGEFPTWQSPCRFSRLTIFMPITVTATSFKASRSMSGGKVVGLLGRNGWGRQPRFIPPLACSIPARERSSSKAKPYPDCRPMRLCGGEWVGCLKDVESFQPSPLVKIFALAAAKSQPGPWTLERIFQEFPILAKRQRSAGDKLSGGEQQMLAIARALIQNPDLILMDEPSEGLAPLIRGEIAEIIRQLNAEGCAILLSSRISPLPFASPRTCWL